MPRRKKTAQDAQPGTEAFDEPSGFEGSTSFDTLETGPALLDEEPGPDSSDDLVPMTRNGETARVHPDSVPVMAALGWLANPARKG